MQFTNQFEIPLPIDQAWPLMLDVPRILPCLPGATLTGQPDRDTYEGQVSVRLGPVKLAFEGQARLVRTDSEQHIAWLEGAGRDPRGRGAAQSTFSFALRPAGESVTQVTVTTDLALTGAVAQYGRGSGMIAEVASQILKQFEGNLADMLQGEDEDNQDVGDSSAPYPPSAVGTHSDEIGHGTPRSEVSGTPTSSVSASAGGQPRVGHPDIDAQAVLAQAQAVLAQAQAIMAMTQSALAQNRSRRPVTTRRTDGELNMLGVATRALWAQVKYKTGRLFGRKSDDA